MCGALADLSFEQPRKRTPQFSCLLSTMTTGLWLGFRIGRATNKGDIRFIYTWARAETDAVPSVFSYSDSGRNGGTNVTGHFIGLEYVLMPRLTPFGEESFR